MLETGESRAKGDCRRIGIEQDISTYATRHTYAMSLKRGGVKLGLISDAMGHADSKVIRHYLSSFEDEMIDEAGGVFVVNKEYFILTIIVHKLKVKVMLRLEIGLIAHAR